MPSYFEAGMARMLIGEIMALFVLLAIALPSLGSGESVGHFDCRNSICRVRLLKWRNGSECLRAELAPISLRISYRCRNFTGTCETRVVMSDYAGVNGSTVRGHCGNRTASLITAWAGGAFQLRMDFQQQTFYSSQIMTSIEEYNFVSQLRLQVDLRDAAFVNASFESESSAIVNFASIRKIFLFAAPVGMEFLCNSPETAKLHQLTKSGGVEGATAEVNFPTVRMEAFSSTAPIGGLLEGPFLCESDSNKQARSVAILAITGLLGVCLFVILCGFLGTRLNRNSGYSSVD